MKLQAAPGAGNAAVAYRTRKSEMQYASIKKVMSTPATSQELQRRDSIATLALPHRSRKSCDIRVREMVVLFAPA